MPSALTIYQLCQLVLPSLIAINVAYQSDFAGQNHMSAGGEQVEGLASILQDDLLRQFSPVLETIGNVNVMHAGTTSNATDLIAEILGAQALTRFSELRKIEAGWNFGGGLPMSFAAESNFFLLLSRLPEKVPNPRLFLMDDGAIELQWRNSLNEPVSVVSTNDQFELFAPNADAARFALTDYQKLIKAAFSPSVGA
jgi:hypothetical protein